MLLHTVNKSPFERNALQSCLRLAKQGSAILLIEDGVYGAMKGSRLEESMAKAAQDCKVYVLGPDLNARGMNSDNVIDNITIVDYSGFVDLVAENDAVQAWL